MNEWNRLFCDDVPVHLVPPFYREATYLDALVEKVNEALSRFRCPERAEIVFSAHSVPMSVIERGDPYQHQIEETVRLLMAWGAWSNPHRLWTRLPEPGGALDVGEQEGDGACRQLA